MRNSMLWGLSAIAMCAASCGYRAPYHASPVAISNQGVRISLAGTRCYVSRSAEQFPTQIGKDRLHVDLRLDVANQSDQLAQVDLNNFRLTDDRADQVVPPVQSGAVRLAPGESRAVDLDFEDSSRPDCRRSLALAAGDAVTLGGAPVELAPIRFQPKR